MKKTLSVFMAVTLAALLCACGTTTRSVNRHRSGMIDGTHRNGVIDGTYRDGIYREGGIDGAMDGNLNPLEGITNGGTFRDGTVNAGNANDTGRDGLINRHHHKAK